MATTYPRCNRNTTERLRRSAAILAVIEQQRNITRDPRLGAGLESFLITRELRDLENACRAEESALGEPIPEVFVTRVRKIS